MPFTGTFIDNFAQSRWFRTVETRIVDLEAAPPGSAAWGDITGTLADQTDLNTALSGKAASTHNHAATDINSGTLPVARLSFTKAELDTAISDGNALYVGDITQYTDELAQDAVGAMVDTSLVYTDGTPLLQRAALTGAVTASAGSNTTALGSFTKAQLDAAVSDGNVLYVGDVTTHTQSHAMTSTSDHTAGNWKLFYSNGSGQVVELALGASGTLLQSAGASSAPTFASIATNPWTTVVATADESVTNSATLADSTYLQFTTTANTNYHVRVRILAYTSSIAADFKYRLTHAGTTTRVRRVRTYSIANGTSATFPTVAPSSAFDAADQTLLTGAIGDMVIYEDIYLQVGASGGVLKFAFAQNTQTALNSVTVYEGSYLEYMTT